MKTPSSGEFGGFGGERARRIENPRKGLSERGGRHLMSDSQLELKFNLL